MKMPPLWKVTRELKRSVWQVVELVPNTWEHLSLRTRYDAFMSKERTTHTGEKPLMSEAAVYLIFPEGGVLTSHLQMLDELNKENISPIVVSNVPIADDDLQTLKKRSAIIIERPNVGYDFGGYRDGILQISDKLSNLDRLYILNDSVWMIDSDRSWFQDARDQNVDFCGATSNYGIKRYSASDFRDFVWQPTPDHPNFHYASYALAVGKKILQDPDFLRYWRKFPLSNKKRKTVKSGEIGLSEWVKKRPYTHTATCDVNTLAEEIKSLSPEDLDNVTRHLVIPDAAPHVALRDVVLRTDLHSPQGISDRIQFILMTVSSQAIGYCMPYYTIKRRGFQFLKKSPLWLSSDSSSVTLRIMKDLDGPLGRQAFQEAKAIVDKKTLKNVKGCPSE